MRATVYGYRSTIPFPKGRRTSKLYKSCGRGWAVATSHQPLPSKAGRGNWPAPFRSSESQGHPDGSRRTPAEQAKTILSLVSDAKNELIDDGKSGTIRLGAIPTIAPYYLPSILRSFAAKFPQARMVVQENTTQVLIQRLHHGEIDLAILAHPIPEKYLEIETLFDEELFLVAAKGHPLTEKSMIRMTDLREYPFVLLEEAHCLSDSIVSLCRSRSFQTHIGRADKPTGHHSRAGRASSRHLLHSCHGEGARS